MSRSRFWPEHDGELASFMQRLTITHVRRWQQHRGYAGLGHVYQGRYKSFPVESDEHFWVVARYVERNALCAQLVLRRRNGDGRVCGDNVTARRRTGPCWRRGQSIGPRIGSSGSIRRTTTRNCNRSAKACSEAARSAIQSGRTNRQTIGLGVGLSSQWSPAESGSIPERLSSVTTHAGARDYLVYQ